MTSADFERRLFEELPDAVIATTAEGRVLYQSKEAEGRLVNELIVPPEQAQEEGERREEAIRSGAVTREALRRRKNGSLVYVDITTRPLYNPDHSLQCLLFTKKDVTILKVHRDARLIDARFRDLLESPPDAIIMVNNTGRIVTFNGQAEQMFRHSKAELVGQPVEILLPARFHHHHVAHRSGYIDKPRTRRMGEELELYACAKTALNFPLRSA